MAIAEPIRILVVEDHHITRAGLILVLKQCEDFEVIGEAADGLSAIEKALELKPAIVLTDIGLPTMSGIEVATELKSKLPETRVIALTSHDDDQTVFAALGAGADGYCLKDIAQDQLYLAIKSVHAGACWLDPAIAKRVLNASVKSPKKTESTDFGLSARELEVLGLIVDGLSNHQIANQLVISHDTVKTHMRHILEKLVVADRTQAAVKALRQGLI